MRMRRNDDQVARLLRGKGVAVHRLAWVGLRGVGFGSGDWQEGGNMLVTTVCLKARGRIMQDNAIL